MDINNSFDINAAGGAQAQWSEAEVAEKLTAIGRLHDKSVAWIQSDLSIAPSSWISRVLRTLLGKHFSWIRSHFFNVDLVSSQRIFRRIRRQIRSDSPLVLIFNEAVSKFNQVAPRHSVQRISSLHLLPFDAIIAISEFLDVDNALNISQALPKGYEWAFLCGHPQQYFLTLCQELKSIPDISEIPEQFKALLRTCTYVDVAKLLQLDCIRNGGSIQELIALFPHVKTLQARGNSIPKEFFTNDLKEILEKYSGIKHLDVSHSRIRDGRYQVISRGSASRGTSFMDKNRWSLPLSSSI